jgi:hypothetical protein
MREACKRLEEKYSEYGHTKVRGNGMAEFVLKKIPARIHDDKNKKTTTRKIRTKKNKTRKNK